MRRSALSARASASGCDGTGSPAQGAVQAASRATNRRPQSVSRAWGPGSLRDRSACATASRHTANSKWARSARRPLSACRSTRQKSATPAKEYTPCTSPAVGRGSLRQGAYSRGSRGSGRRNRPTWWTRLLRTECRASCTRVAASSVASWGSDRTTPPTASEYEALSARKRGVRGSGARVRSAKDSSPAVPGWRAASSRPASSRSRRHVSSSAPVRGGRAECSSRKSRYGSQSSSTKACGPSPPPGGRCTVRTGCQRPPGDAGSSDSRIRRVPRVSVAPVSGAVSSTAVAYSMCGPGNSARPRVGRHTVPARAGTRTRASTPARTAATPASACRYPVSCHSGRPPGTSGGSPDRSRASRSTAHTPTAGCVRISDTTRASAASARSSSATASVTGGSGPGSPAATTAAVTPRSISIRRLRSPRFSRPAVPAPTCPAATASRSATGRRCRAVPPAGLDVAWDIECSVLGGVAPHGGERAGVRASGVLSRRFPGELREQCLLRLGYGIAGQGHCFPKTTTAEIDKSALDVGRRSPHVRLPPVGSRW